MNIIVWVVLELLAGAIAKAIYPGYHLVETSGESKKFCNR
jgi:uncharacterized membrane protein YeaQ/YmgE (transglycosylase-associated protein family)